MLHPHPLYCLIDVISAEFYFPAKNAVASFWVTGNGVSADLNWNLHTFIKIWNRITVGVLKQDPNTKRFKRTLVYLTRTHSMQIFREIPYVKPQNDTSEPFCAWIYIHLFFLFGKILLDINEGGGGGGGLCENQCEAVQCVTTHNIERNEVLQLFYLLLFLFFYFFVFNCKRKNRTKWGEQNPSISY